MKLTDAGLKAIAADERDSQSIPARPFRRTRTRIRRKCDMGGNRQNVQRIVNDLEQEGFVEFQPNPHHRRAQLVVLTDKGKKAFDAAMRLQARWANELTEGLRVEDIATTRSVITALRKRLEATGDTDEQV